MRHTFRYTAVGEVMPGAHVGLSDRDAHHLSRVVRRRPGDQVELIDGEGRIWPATVVDDGGAPMLRVGAAPRETPPAAPVTLYQGLGDWNRIDVVIEKAAELGVERIVLMATERVRRRPEPDAWRRRRERLDRVAEAAARQSGRGTLPRIGGLVDLAEALEEAGEGAILLDPRGDRPLGEELEHAAGAGPVRLLVGPDTGFSEAELAAARGRGACICTLGAATLRTETAALVALSLALDATSHLRMPPRDHGQGVTAQ
ncbi:MAG: RsmE family RNA methyltransferase [Thermoleophilia bacterium]